MKIPGHVIFGPDINYAKLRRMSEDEQIVELKRRIDAFLIRQTDELGKDTTGRLKVKSPWPLAVMTCVGIEAIGRIMYRQLINNTEESKKAPFVNVASSLDSEFSRTLSKDIKRAIEARYDRRDRKNFKTIADIIYTFFRNTMIHEYRGLAVFLDDEEGITWKLHDEGFLVINPYWLWEAFKNKTEELFAEAQESDQKNNPRRVSCIEYINELLR